MPKDPVCGMEVDEKSALKLTRQGKTDFFCSELCLNRFAKENRIFEREIAPCLVCVKKPFYKERLFIVSAVLASLVLVSFAVPVLEPFRKSFLVYLKTIWWAIILGLFFGGVIDHFVPREYVSHLLASPGKRSIFYSVILGFFMSTCSHGILALSIELHKKGASNPAVVSFLLASPWANMTLTIMLIGFFGLKALFIIVSAILIAIVTGLIYQIFEKSGMIEKNENIVRLEEDFSLIEDIRKRFSKYRLSFEGVKSDIKGIYKGMVSLGNMVLWWILIGMGIAGIAGGYIPPHVFDKYMGPTMLGLITTLAVATVIEVCSEGSAPMAFEIFRQTRALGNSLVFLMAGVVTDYTEIGLLWHNVGRKVAVWLPVVTIPQVIILGLIANIVFS